MPPKTRFSFHLDVMSDGSRWGVGPTETAARKASCAMLIDLWRDDTDEELDAHMKEALADLSMIQVTVDHVPTDRLKQTIRSLLDTDEASVEDSLLLDAFLGGVPDAQAAEASPPSEPR